MSSLTSIEDKRGIAAAKAYVHSLIGNEGAVQVRVAEEIVEELGLRQMLPPDDLEWAMRYHIERTRCGFGGSPYGGGSFLHGLRVMGVDDKTLFKVSVLFEEKMQAYHYGR